MLVSTLLSVVHHTISTFRGTVLRGFKGAFYALAIPLYLGWSGFAFEAKCVHGELTLTAKVMIPGSAVPPFSSCPHGTCSHLGFPAPL